MFDPAFKSETPLEAILAAVSAETVAEPENIIEFDGGYEIRHVAGKNALLRWQAGKIITEHREYRDPGMWTEFNQRVTLFHLLGHGSTRAEAIAMARSNPNR